MINLSILKMTQSRKQGIKATKNVDISTGATVEIKVSVYLYIRVKFVQLILRRANAR